MNASKYRCVNRRKKKWEGSFQYKGQLIWCGGYDDELDAALAVNKKCDEMGIQRKNPDIGSYVNEEVIQNETVKYEEVENHVKLRVIEFYLSFQLLRHFHLEF